MTSRDGHSSSFSMSPALLVLLHRLQVHIAAVLCTSLPVESEVCDRDSK